MRSIFLPFLLWLGALQSTTAASSGFEGSARLAAVAGALGTLTVFVYRLGIWRQEMENTKHNVGAEVTRFREEVSSSFARLERRLHSIEKRLEHLEEAPV